MTKYQNFILFSPGGHAKPVYLRLICKWNQFRQKNHLCLASFSEIRKWLSTIVEDSWRESFFWKRKVTCLFCYLNSMNIFNVFVECEASESKLSTTSEYDVKGENGKIIASEMKQIIM